MRLNASLNVKRSQEQQGDRTLVIYSQAGSPPRASNTYRR